MAVGNVSEAEARVISAKVKAMLQGVGARPVLPSQVGAVVMVQSLHYDRNPIISALSAMWRNLRCSVRNCEAMHARVVHVCHCSHRTRAGPVGCVRRHLPLCECARRCGTCGVCSCPRARPRCCRSRGPTRTMRTAPSASCEPRPLQQRQLTCSRALRACAHRRTCVHTRSAVRAVQVDTRPLRTACPLPSCPATAPSRCAAGRA